MAFVYGMENMKDIYQSLGIKVLSCVVDFCLIGVAFSITGNPVLTLDSAGSKELTSFFLTFSLIWIIAGFFLKTYMILAVASLENISINLLKTFLLHVAMVVTMLTASDVFSVNGMFLMRIYLIAAVLITSSRILFKLISTYFEFCGFEERRVIIIGATRSGEALHAFFETHRSAGYEFKGFFADESPESFSLKKLIAGKVNEIEEFCARERIDEIYFTLPITHNKLLEELLKFADDNFIYFRIAPDFGKVIQRKFNLFVINSVPVLSAGTISLDASTERGFLFPTIVTQKILSFFPLMPGAAHIDSIAPVTLTQPVRWNRLSDSFRFRTSRANHNTEIRTTWDEALIDAYLHKSKLDDLPYCRGRPPTNSVSQLGQRSQVRCTLS